MTASLIDRQRRSFDHLVEEGVYSQDSEHAPEAKAFVGAALAADGLLGGHVPHRRQVGRAAPWHDPTS